MKTVLGIELGSTRIKAVTLDECFRPVSSGSYTWASRLENGIWTYSMDEVWQGMRQALAGIKYKDNIECIGVSAMMMGYLVFDKDWRLLTPFRTWQNIMAENAAAELTELFGRNVQHRWGIAHLYQAILNNEEHVKDIAHMTSLAGYVHYMLTGVYAAGIGDADGIFPINNTSLDYDADMIEKFDRIAAEHGMPWKIRDLLPKVLTAGEDAGCLTETGSALLGGIFKPGITVASPEGDAQTGMTATNSIAPRTGIISAGTSIFAMVVLERPLSRIYEEIGIYATPTGRPVACIHCNNGTTDTNAWAGIISEAAEMFGVKPDTGELFSKLYEKSLEGDPDCGGITVCNYISGEASMKLNEGRPMVIRSQNCRFTLANFFRAQLYTIISTLVIGMEVLRREKIAVDRMMCNGGLFKTPLVGQKYVASACDLPITCMESAGEGGPFGMALLASYRMYRGDGESLEDYLKHKVFADAHSVTVMPDPEIVAGFAEYIQRFRAMISVERLAKEKL